MSLSFKQLTELKEGQTFWEKTHQFKLVEDPKVQEHPYFPDKLQVTFKAQHMENGDVVEYFATEEFMHYGPRISYVQEYGTWPYGPVNN